MIQVARAHRVLAALAIALSVAGVASADTRNRVSIENFAEVNGGYFRGAQPVGRDYADLAAIGVKLVINLTDDDGQADEQATVERAGMKYLSIPMSTRRAPTAAQIETFLNAVQNSGPVYVHCVGGKHRTGVMTAVYRMTHDGISGAQAFQEMKKYKYGPDFLHPEFKSFVYSYKPVAPVAVKATSSSQQQQQQ